MKAKSNVSDGKDSGSAKWEDGIIEIWSPEAKELGFTDELFHGYLWKRDKYIIISTIFSKKPGNGNLSKLFNAIEARGYEILVPTPMRQMQEILHKKGFAPKFQSSEGAIYWGKDGSQILFPNH